MRCEDVREGDGTCIVMVGDGSCHCCDTCSLPVPLPVVIVVHMEGRGWLWARAGRGGAWCEDVHLYVLAPAPPHPCPDQQASWFQKGGGCSSCGRWGFLREGIVVMERFGNHLIQTPKILAKQPPQAPTIGF